MEEEEDVMIKECKISMPFYKIAYAISFVIILSLVRGVFISYEVGIALEPQIAILAAAFCADTYAVEIAGNRSEVWRLYPMKKRLHAIGMRMVIQDLFLFLLAAAGYGLFFLFQKPEPSGMIYEEAAGETMQFLVFLASCLITIVFWGIWSGIIACIFRSMWFGIGGSLILWILTNSSSGDEHLGKWNLFSYSFRNVENSSDLSWLAGKGVCLALCVVIAAALPYILKKRG